MDLENLLLDWLEPFQAASSKNWFPTRESLRGRMNQFVFVAHYVASAALMLPVETRVTSNLQYSYDFCWDYRQAPCLARHFPF